MNLSDANTFRPALWTCLRKPVEQIQALNRQGLTLTQLPYTPWMWLSLIAVAGTGIYGASLRLAVREWSAWQVALCLILATGLSWCVFGPLLVVLTRRNAFVCAHACLVTMAYGEGVLLITASLNALCYILGHPICSDPKAFNVACVAASNIIMAVALTRQLSSLGVPHWKTLLLWAVALDGCGIAFFFLLYPGLVR